MQQSGIIRNVLTELADVVSQLSNSEYTSRSVNLSGATIGQHLRHIIELFQCLDNGYIDGLVNYEKRNRDVRIEADKDAALMCIDNILANTDKEDKYITLEAGFGGENSKVLSSYYRELIYNLEHAIHHMALMRVGINELTSISLSETFGVAPSTIEYRRKCAQ